MAEQNFAIHTQPHVANVGDVKLLFEPEVLGAEFADAYAGLKAAQQRLTAAGDDIGPDELRDVNAGMRTFLATFLQPESRAVFEATRIPDRVLVQMIEWTSELYGGSAPGKEADPGGSSSAS